MLRFKSLGSGSAGNATVVQARSGPHMIHLLVDCGLGLRHLDRRLGAAGLLAEQIDAIFITHEHGDHIGCARQLALRERIPVWMSRGTYAAIGEPDLEGLLHLASDGAAIDLGSMSIHPFTVPHDAREPLQLACSDGDSRLGILTDLGHVTRHVLDSLAGCRSVMLECNHDTDLLASGSYPPALKQRVGGYWGHLCNQAAAEAARSLCESGLQQIVAAHLSEQNNRPELARSALEAALAWHAEQIHVADAATGCTWLQA